MDSVQIQMQELLDEYSRDVNEAVEKAAKESAKESAKMLMENSPVNRRGKRPGKYAKGWRYKKDGERSYVVYNATDWQLTHLLENGHDIFRGGKYIGHFGGKPHIALAEQSGSEGFYIRVSQGLGK